MVCKAPLPLLLAVIALTSCVRRDGRNSDCKWPGEPEIKRLQTGQPDYAQHLIEDAEFAEELAIRYMDSHHAPRSGKPKSHQTASQAKNWCMGVLFGEIGRAHDVTPAEVFKFLSHRRMYIDFVVNLPFVLIYCFSSGMIVRRLHGRYPPNDGWTAWIVMIFLASLTFGIGAMVLGEQWSIMAEMVRVGNGHLSNRAFRLPWVQYRSEFFAFAVILFWVIAAVYYRSGQQSASAGAIAENPDR